MIVAAGVAAGVVLLRAARGAPRGTAGRGFATRAARAELYGNEINDNLVVRPGGQLVTGLTLFDDTSWTASSKATALGVGGTGLVLRLTQTGFVRSYALSLLAGAVLVVVALLAVNLA